MAKDWSNYTDPDVALTRGWGVSVEDGGIKAKEDYPQANRVILGYLVSHRGLNLIDIAQDTGINYDHLSDYYGGNNKAMTKEDDARLVPFVREQCADDAERAMQDHRAGRPARRTVYRDLADAGFDTEKTFGVKL